MKNFIKNIYINFTLKKPIKNGNFKYILFTCKYCKKLMENL